MFPRLRERLDTALDVLVEFSTLGEYRLEASAAPGIARVEHPSGLGGAGPPAGPVPASRAVAGGATGGPPVATPAGRRLAARNARGEHPPVRFASRRRSRAGALPPVEQVCLESG
jgi:hypothetical protein